MSDYDDPPEFTGADATTRAEPGRAQPGKSAAPVAPLAEELSQPAEPVAKPMPNAAPVVAEVECTPFDSMGNIASPDAFLTAKLKASEPEKYKRLMVLLSANVETKDAEKAERETQARLHEAVADAQRKRAAYHKLMPQATFLDEHRRVIAARQGRPIPPPTIHPNAEGAAIAADEAEALIGNIRIELASAQAIVKSKRTTLAEAILAWQGVTPKLTTADLIRARSKAERDRALAVARGEIEPDAEPEHVHVEPIDAALSGYRGSVNARYGRPRAGLRGELAPVRSSTSREF